MIQLYRDILVATTFFFACLGAGLVLGFVISIALGGAGSRGGNISPKDKP